MANRIIFSSNFCGNSIVNKIHIFVVIFVFLFVFVFVEGQNISFIFGCESIYIDVHFKCFLETERMRR